MYDCQLPTRVTADASSYGLGAVLEQKQHDDEWKPVAYASKTLTETQSRYSQIEKEALSIVWACEKFQDFLIGIEFEVVTDHKPLVPILSTKALNDLSPRLQRFKMRLMRYSYSIRHVPGKDIITADVLSRAPQKQTESCLEDNWDRDVQEYVDYVYQSLPASYDKLLEISKEQERDPVCSKITEATLRGWRQSDRKLPILKPYWQWRSGFSVQKDLLMHHGELVIPKSTQNDVLQRIHEGHLGVTKCKQRAKDAVWWLGIGKAINDFVMFCATCAKVRTPITEPMIPSKLPDRPWEKLGADLMEMSGKHYLVLVDYYSRYPELALLSSTTSSSVISHLKSFFARHGIPETLISDNGPQFASEEFRSFAESYGFVHVTSSPKFPRSNGLAEATVKTMKRLLEKSEDPHRALLAYRGTPLEHGLSPAELLMGRKLRTTVPTAKQHLLPKAQDLNRFRQADEQIKQKQQRSFNKRHEVKVASSLHSGDKVWIPDMKQYGHVIDTTPYPRSYHVNTPSGTLRRNREQLRLMPTEQTNTEVQDQNEDQPESSNSLVSDTSQQTDHTSKTFRPKQSPPTNLYQTRSGRVSVPPKRLVYS